MLPQEVKTGTRERSAQPGGIVFANKSLTSFR